MPPPRTTRPKPVTNENAENDGTTRLTRAKAANIDSGRPTTGAAAGAGAIKRPLQSKKSATNTLTAAAAAPLQRKRAALGDVSNTTKPEVEAKKPRSSGKVGLVSKASQVAGVQKSSRTTASRAALSAKDANRRATKRQAISVEIEGRDRLEAVKDTVKDAVKETIKETVKEAVTETVAPATIVEPVTSPLPEKIEQPEKIRKAEVLEVRPDEDEQQDFLGAAADASVDAIPAGVRNLDEEEREDPLMVSEYAPEIYEYLRELEKQTLPNPKYMDHQEELEWNMRGILVDWLIEVHGRFHLLPETLYLAVNIVDRFLSLKVVQLDRLQLVGIAAMFIASKYEEVLSPHVANFRHVADDGFTEHEILSAERYILGALSYDLSYPNPINFLRRISKAEGYDIHTRTLAKYLLEISCLDHRLLRFPPSQLAAGAMYLSRMILDRGLDGGYWDEALIHYSTYTEEQVVPVAKIMLDYLARPVVHDCFYKKYGCKKYLKASLFARSWVKRYYGAEVVATARPLYPINPLTR